jgi:nitroreductase
MSITPKEVTNLIQNRRSIFPKLYTDEPVAKEILEQILENANYAPTHKLTEPWRFKVFQGQSLERLGKFLAESYKGLTEAKGTFSERKYKKSMANPSKASAVIAIVMNRDAEERIPEIEEICSVACAVQNMALTATAYGLGAYWSSPGYVFSPAMNEFLSIGEKDKCLGLFYIGHHRAPDLPAKRTPIADKVEWINE